jgi:ATP-dependent Clp protease ATP-binding subunit ClpC
MAEIKLQIPTLVKDLQLEQQRYYFLRPLFLNYPLAAHRRYEQAVLHYKKEVRQLFNGFELDQRHADDLLWFAFKPPLEYQRLELSFDLGRRYIKGGFAMVSFALKGQRFLYLPDIDNFLCLLRDDGASLEAEASRIIVELLRRLKQEQKDAFDPQAYLSAPRDFIAYIEIALDIAHPPFRFNEQPWHPFFASMEDEDTFDGAAEILRIGQNLNERYPAELQRAYFRDEWVAEVSRVLFQGDQTPLAIVGPEGIGKHALIDEAIWRYENSAQPGRQQQHVWQIDPHRIISGMSVVGMWQKRFEAILKFLRQSSLASGFGDKLLIDKPVALARIGKSAQSNMTLSDVLRPYLEKRELQVVLLATPAEWDTLQEEQRRFSSLFRVLRLEQPDLATAVKIVLKKRQALEAIHGCAISIQALQQLLSIQRHYLRHKALPGSIIKLMEELAVRYRSGLVDAPQVKAAFKAYSGLEERIFDPSRAFSAQEVAEVLGQELVGQPEAVEALADTIHLIKANLADRGRPLASFLFIGPTGVGKTQAAKVLCKYLMGDEAQLLRFDMNEYLDPGALQRLVGDEYRPEGQLTGAVRFRPFSILLLDEIEKAHPSVRDLLLQVLDDGRLTDSLGRTVDFTNTIIVMTSNVGAREAGTHLGFPEKTSEGRQVYRRAMETAFRPEFINRIGKVVVFQPLQLPHILDIARLQIYELLQRDGFVRRSTILNISPEALEWVAGRGYDANMGGRALKRQIERDLTVLSAEQLISSSLDATILFDIVLKDGRLMPIIEPLHFIEPAAEAWLPSLPDEANGGRFYRQLIKRLEQIKATLADFEERHALDWKPLVFGAGQTEKPPAWQDHYYQYKDRLEAARTAVQNISLAFRDRHYKYGPAIPLRLKNVRVESRSDWSAKGVRQNIKDGIFQMEALKEINEAYQFGAASFDSFKTECLSHFLDVAFLELQLPDVLERRLQRCRIEVRPHLSGLGREEAVYLLEKYAQVLALLDVQHESHLQDGYLEVEGFGLEEIFEGEEGVHLFYSSHRSPLPVRVSLSPDLPGYKARRVVRLYHGRDTLTDLYTGYSNVFDLSPAEFRLLLLARHHVQQSSYTARGHEG